MEVRTLWVHASAGAACGNPGLGLNANAVVTVSRAPQGMEGGEWGWGGMEGTGPSGRLTLEAARGICMGSRE